MTAPTMTGGHRGLKIERIECIPLSMPLPRTYRGSNYFMTHRCTIITRLYTSEGIVGEVYNGDEFETQAEVLRIINEEIAPKLIGMDAFNTEGCWQAMRKPPPTTSCATASSASAPSPASTAPSGTRSARRSTCRSTSSGAASPTRCRSSASPATTRKARRWPISAARWNRSATPGFAGCKFKVGGRTPEEDAERVRTARAAAGRDFVLTIDANQGYTLRQAVDFSPARRGPGTSAGSRSRCAGTTTASTWPRSAQHDRHPGLRRAERDQPRRLPRPDDGGRHRRLQFRRELGRRADRMAPRRRHSPPASGSRWAITRSRRFRRISSLPSLTPPIWKPFIRTAIRCSTLSSPTARPSRRAATSVPEGAGFGLKLDESGDRQVSRVDIDADPIRRTSLEWNRRMKAKTSKPSNEPPPRSSRSPTRTGSSCSG